MVDGDAWGEVRSKSGLNMGVQQRNGFLPPFVHVRDMWRLLEIQRTISTGRRSKDSRNSRTAA